MLDLVLPEAMVVGVKGDLVAGGDCLPQTEGKGGREDRAGGQESA
jgi:hypothetical protein